MSFHSKTNGVQHRRLIVRVPTVAIHQGCDQYLKENLPPASPLYSIVVYHERLTTRLPLLIMATQMDTVHLPALVIMDKNVTSWETSPLLLWQQSISAWLHVPFSLWPLIQSYISWPASSSSALFVIKWHVADVRSVHSQIAATCKCLLVHTGQLVHCQVWLTWFTLAVHFVRFINWDLQMVPEAFKFG